jgi:hypothetical protein
MELEVQMHVKFDCVTGNSKRYIVGKPGGKISGAIYITSSQPVPEQIILIFPKEVSKG